MANEETEAPHLSADRWGCSPEVGVCCPRSCLVRTFSHSASLHVSSAPLKPPGSNLTLLVHRCVSYSSRRTWQGGQGMATPWPQIHTWGTGGSWAHLSPPDDEWFLTWVFTSETGWTWLFETSDMYLLDLFSVYIKMFWKTSRLRKPTYGKSLEPAACAFP